MTRDKYLLSLGANFYLIVDPFLKWTKTILESCFIWTCPIPLNVNGSTCKIALTKNICGILSWKYTLKYSLSKDSYKRRAIYSGGLISIINIGVQNIHIRFLSTAVTVGFVIFSMLGQGAFGEVYEGRLKNLCANVSELPVAVKVNKLLSLFFHPHVSLHLMYL